MNGFLCVLKPPGMTSSDVVVTVRRRMQNKEKVGHAGTLDPEACGVLPIMVGKASRLFDYLVDKEKSYIAQFKPGYSTDTQDAQGDIVAGIGQRVTRAQLEAVLPQFMGDIMQVPPMYSALKRDGKKLYELARAGITVDVPARKAEIFDIHVNEELSDGSFLLHVRCGRGTYIRTLCHDVGKALGCEAHMGYLLRTHTGVFTLEDAHTVEAIMNDAIKPLLMPMDAPLLHLPRVEVDAAAEHLVINGNRIPLRALQGDMQCEEQPLRVYLKNQFAGIGHITQEMLKFDAMLLER